MVNDDGYYMVNDILVGGWPTNQWLIYLVNIWLMMMVTIWLMMVNNNLVGGWPTIVVNILLIYG